MANGLIEVDPCSEEAAHLVAPSPVVRRGKGMRAAAIAGFSFAFLVGLLVACMAAGRATLMDSHKTTKDDFDALYVFTAPPGTRAYQPLTCVYRIKNVRSGLYITQTGEPRDLANVGVNSEVSLYTKWLVTPTDDPDVYHILSDSNKAYSMNLAAGGQLGYTNVQLYSNPSNADSQWQFFRIGSSVNFLIRNIRGDYFVHAAGATPGSNVDVNNDPNTPLNQWQLELLTDTCKGVAIETPDGTTVASDLGQCGYRLKNPTSSRVLNLALEMSNNPTGNDSNFTLHEVSDGVYTIRSMQDPNQYVQINGGTVTRGTDPLESSTRFAIFRYTYGLDGNPATAQYAIRNVIDNIYLATNAEGKSVQAASGQSSDNYRWVLEAIGTCKEGDYPTMGAIQLKYASAWPADIDTVKGEVVNSLRNMLDNHFSVNGYSNRVLSRVAVHFHPADNDVTIVEFWGPCEDMQALNALSLQDMQPAQLGNPVAVEMNAETQRNCRDAAAPPPRGPTTPRPAPHGISTMVEGAEDTLVEEEG